MPSASAKVEKVSLSESIDSPKQIVNLLEKRLRNLEKRKMKLDNYRSDVEKGKELNEDQRMAVSKYDEVLCLLDFTKELCKLTNAIFLESTRQQKKQAKKEQLERQQHEIQRLQEAFIYRNILSSFQNDDVRNDFLNGENSAIQLSNEQLSQLDSLYKLIGAELPKEQADITNYFRILSENLIFLVEGKNKEIAGTTYKVLKELLQSIKESGYFTRPSEEPVEDGTSSDEMPEEETVVEKVECSQEYTAPPEEYENAPDHVSDSYEIAEEHEDLSVTTPPETVVQEAVPIIQNAPLQEVLSTQGTINFLQESQIDLGAPHMDPAVVAVHQMAPPPTINFGVNAYPTAPPVEEISQPLMNGTDPHEMSMSPPSVGQIPVLPTGIPRTAPPPPPVLTSVQHGGQHDFDPSHPILTQTFTNQSFAYVPVTMHHGPLPPHMTPIAVVPGPAVSSAPASVVPIPVPVGPVPVSLQAGVVPSAMVPNSEVDEIQPNGESTPSDVDLSLNDLSISDKGNEGNGYGNYRGGYRGRGRARGNNGYFRRMNFHNGHGGYQNHYYQDRNGYNGNYRRNNNRGPRGTGNNRGRGNYNRTQAPQQQQQPSQPQTQETQQ